MGPNGLVVVNHRAVWAGDGDSTIKVCSLGGQLVATISTGASAPATKASRAEFLAGNQVIKRPSRFSVLP
jgi:hypothetical protein